MSSRAGSCHILLPCPAVSGWPVQQHEAVQPVRVNRFQCRLRFPRLSWFGRFSRYCMWLSDSFQEITSFGWHSQEYFSSFKHRQFTGPRFTRFVAQAVWFSTRFSRFTVQVRAGSNTRIGRVVSKISHPGYLVLLNFSQNVPQI